MTNFETKTCDTGVERAQYICPNSPSEDLDDFIFQGEPVKTCSER